MRVLILATFVVLISGMALADLPRHPVTGPPKTARGAVERFLILQKQLFISESVGFFGGVSALQGGVLVPVSEDRDGIYYQNLNGVWMYDNHYGYSLARRELPGIWYRGGLYFSKTKMDEVHAYTGDARKQDAYLEMDHRAVTVRALAKLRIGHVANKRKNSER